MKSASANTAIFGPASILCGLAWACLSAPAFLAAQQPIARSVPPPTAASPTGARTFETPAQAADALVDAAERFDVAALTQIFGPEGHDIVLSGEFAQDRKHATNFASEARRKKSVSIDPRAGNRGFLLVGDENWPFPVPLVKSGEKWLFDSKAGRQELVYRRIGENELDAIEICRGYVEAQHEYALQQRPINSVNEYAQRIVSTPGKQDG